MVVCLMTPCSFVYGYQIFVQTGCLRLQPPPQAVIHKLPFIFFLFEKKNIDSFVMMVAPDATNFITKLIPYHRL